MKAAILTSLNKPLVIDEVEAPRPGYGQVLARVCYSGVCGSQLGEIAGVKGPDKYLPHLLGHEGSGVVLETGPGVTTVSRDDHVVLHWRPGAGIQSAAPVYRWNADRLNAGWVTTFNELAVVSENRLTRIPADFDLAVAPLLGCAVTTGMGVINNDARVKSGESVVVFGAGGVGLSVVQAAALAGATPIIALDLYDEKLALARRLGATHAVNTRKADPRPELLECLGAHGADVVVDNTGDPKVIELAYSLTHAQGRTILVGVPRKGELISIDSMPLHFGRVLKGSHGGDADPALDIPRCLRLCQAGRLALKELITDRCRLEDINQGLERLRSGKVVGRLLVEVSPV